MFTCLVIVMCLLGRSWFASQNSSTFGVGFGCFVLFCFLFRYPCWPLCFVFVLVVVSRVVSFCVLPLSTEFLLWRLDCSYNLSAIVMASFRSYQ